MKASDLQTKITYRNKIISDAQKFNKRHKRLSFFGLAYALIAIGICNVIFYFYRNSKRYLCIASILLFFVASSSFSYPSMRINISFASSGAETEGLSDEKTVLSTESVAVSDAQLADEALIDTEIINESTDGLNPDVAEIEGYASAVDILDSDNSDEFVSNGTGEDATESFRTEFSEDEWSIILVNKQHPIPDDYSFNLGTISGSMECDERIISPLVDMMKAARADGVNLIVCSPYRDIDRQTMLFSNKVNRYMNGGMSYMDAYNLASQAVTVPGSSEHQIGLAVDIITDGYSSLDEGFGETAAGKWLQENSYRYGFILRYPSGKEEITSIEYEPWHYRYVGTDAAAIIKENGICLEEFWNIYVD